MNVSTVDPFHRISSKSQSKVVYIRTLRGASFQNTSNSLFKKTISQRDYRRAIDCDVIQLTLEKFQQNKSFKQKLKQDPNSENYLMQEYNNLVEKSKDVSKTLTKMKTSESQGKRIFHEKRLLRTSLLWNNSGTINPIQQAKPNHQHSAHSVMRLPSFLAPATENMPRFKKNVSISQFQSSNTVSSQLNPSLLKPTNMQNFNDFYRVPTKQENALAKGKKQPNYLLIVAATKKQIKEIRIRKAESHIRPRSSNLAKNLQMLCDSFKPRTSLNNLEIVGAKKISLLGNRVRSNSALNSHDINDAGLVSKNKPSSADLKNKRTFSDYSKKNLKFSSYYQNLDRSFSEATKSRRLNMIFGHEQDEHGLDDPGNLNNQPSHLTRDSTRTVDMPPEVIDHHSKLDIDHACFRTEECPLSILHKYPFGVKPPYVYEYSSQFHYSSYWMDCIQRLCDEKDLCEVTAFGYYNLRENEAHKGVNRFQEPLRSVLKMTKKIVCDINSEHQIALIAENSMII